MAISVRLQLRQLAAPLRNVDPTVPRVESNRSEVNVPDVGSAGVARWLVLAPVDDYGGVTLLVGKKRFYLGQPIGKRFQDRILPLLVVQKGSKVEVTQPRARISNVEFLCQWELDLESDQVTLQRGPRQFVVSAPDQRHINVDGVQYFLFTGNSQGPRYFERQADGTRRVLGFKPELRPIEPNFIFRSEDGRAVAWMVSHSVHYRDMAELKTFCRSTYVFRFLRQKGRLPQLYVDNALHYEDGTSESIRLTEKMTAATLKASGLLSDDSNVESEINRLADSRATVPLDVSFSGGMPYAVHLLQSQGGRALWYFRRVLDTRTLQASEFSLKYFRQIGHSNRFLVAENLPTHIVQKGKFFYETADIISKTFYLRSSAEPIASRRVHLVVDKESNTVLAAVADPAGPFNPQLVYRVINQQSFKSEKFLRQLEKLGCFGMAQQLQKELTAGQKPIHLPGLEWIDDPSLREHVRECVRSAPSEAEKYALWTQFVRGGRKDMGLLHELVAYELGYILMITRREVGAYPRQLFTEFFKSAIEGAVIAGLPGPKREGYAPGRGTPFRTYMEMWCVAYIQQNDAYKRGVVPMDQRRVWRINQVIEAMQYLRVSKDQALEDLQKLDEIAGLLKMRPGEVKLILQHDLDTYQQNRGPRSFDAPVGNEHDGDNETSLLDLTGSDEGSQIIEKQAVHRTLRQLLDTLASELPREAAVVALAFGQHPQVPNEVAGNEIGKQYYHLIPRTSKYTGPAQPLSSTAVRKLLQDGLARLRALMDVQGLTALDFDLAG